MIREQGSKGWQIDLILHKIFSYLSKADLLNCSLVNLCWSFNARAALRKRDCMAIINGKCSCQDIRNLCSTLQTSSNIPFNGLYFSNKYSLCLGGPHVNFTSEDINAFKNIRLQHVKLHY
ncbi:unnamed protein product [Allacma fusca]|uniref:F-box domain-containing protein n=1 Tax=Allacma fusca TaxID=39272 RepID=A0A8J2PGH8_9HEXA|nr:unnamed protein product [Allacma fusca]